MAAVLRAHVTSTFPNAERWGLLQCAGKYVQAAQLCLDSDLQEATAALRARKSAAAAALLAPPPAPTAADESLVESARDAFAAAREEAVALGLTAEVAQADAAAAARLACALRSAEAAVSEGSLVDVTARLQVLFALNCQLVMISRSSCCKTVARILLNSHTCQYSRLAKQSCSERSPIFGP